MEIRAGDELTFINEAGVPVDVIVVESEYGLPYLVNLRFLIANNREVMNVPVKAIHNAAFIGM